MPQPNTPTDTPRLNYTIDEACRMIPASRPHVNRLLRSGALAKRKLGKRVLIPAKALFAYVESLNV